MNRESDLLLGLVALQMRFITQEQLLECSAVWMQDPGRGLGRLLLDHKYIAAAEHAVLKGLVEAHLKRHGGDPGRSLAAMPVDRALRENLLGLKPPADVQASIVALRPVDPFATVVVARPKEEGRYRLGDEIGRGGLGRVLEAEDRDLEREVAIKLVIDDLPAHYLERFVREAKITARVNHPNVVHVHDFGEMNVARASPPAPGQAGRPPRGQAGALPHKSLFLCMERIRGRDLGVLLRKIEKGDPALRRTFSRARLLSTFQNVCLAMAYAHDKGVVHRDLKPSNVMIGDYGETLVVDWGLAKRTNEGRRTTTTTETTAETTTETTTDATSGAAKRLAAGPVSPRSGDEGIAPVRRSPRGGGGRGEAPGRMGPGKISPEGAAEARSSDRQSTPTTPELTVDGEILGTPAYMPPEQAAGRTDEIDARSDIYSLGAILYEILTFRPPFEGNSVDEILSRVRSGRITPPSTRVRSAPVRAARSAPVRAPSAGAAEATTETTTETTTPPHGGTTNGADLAQTVIRPPSAVLRALEPIPPELDAICLKAMAFRKEDRYQTATELHHEIQEHLEGVKERERRHALAEECAREGRDHARAYFDLKGKLVAANKRAREAAEKIEGYEPVEEKRPIWSVEDAATAMEKSLVRAFSDAISKYMEGIGHEPANEDVRRGLSELYWDRFLEAEERDHEADQAYYQGLVLTYGREWYEKRLKGEGTLAIRTQEHPCDRVEPARSGALQRAAGVVPEAPCDAEASHYERGGFHVKFHPDEMVPCAWGSREMREVDKSLVPRIDGVTLECVAEATHPAGAASAAHSDAPAPTPRELAGVDVWLWKYEERDRRLVPVYPESVVVSAVVSGNPQSKIQNPSTACTSAVPPSPRSRSSPVPTSSSCAGRGMRTSVARSSSVVRRRSNGPSRCIALECGAEAPRPGRNPLSFPLLFPSVRNPLFPSIQRPQPRIQNGKMFRTGSSWSRAANSSSAARPPEGTSGRCETSRTSSSRSSPSPARSTWSS